MVHLITKVAEYGIIINQEKEEFLLLKMGKLFDYSWHFPGGRLDEGDKEKEGLIREIKEEIDVEVKNIKPVYAKFIGKEILPNHHHRYALFYLCELKKEQTIELKEKEIHAFSWLKKEDLPKIKFWIPFYKEMLEEVLPF